MQHEIRPIFLKQCDVVISNPSNYSEEVLESLYGLFKQATVGNAPTSSPSLFNVSQFRKWEIWNNYRDTPPLEAMRKYIEVSSKPCEYE